MAAVPSTIGRPVLRPPVEGTGRLRLVGDEIGGATGMDRGARSRKKMARRRLGTVAAVCCLVGLWFGTGVLAQSPRAEPPPALRTAAGAVYVVRAGDTLESIAQSLVPRRDVPALVHSFAVELRGASFRPGTELRIPSAFASRSITQKSR
ncbi:MAG: hypothetical protein WCF24_11160 [Acidimicrobiales bacterium]